LREKLWLSYKNVAATVIPAVDVVIVAVEVAVDRAASFKLAVAGAKLIVVVVISGVELYELAVDAMVERACTVVVPVDAEVCIPVAVAVVIKVPVVVAVDDVVMSKS